MVKGAQVFTMVQIEYIQGLTCKSSKSTMETQKIETKTQKKNCRNQNWEILHKFHFNFNLLLYNFTAEQSGLANPVEDTLFASIHHRFALVICLYCFMIL